MAGSLRGMSAVWQTLGASARKKFLVEARNFPRDAKQVLVRVVAAGVNMSDAKMVDGLMPFVKPPIVSGRDYSGVVESGPTHLVGKEVFGTGGSLGFLRDGSHSQFLLLPDETFVVEKPTALSHDEAGTLGVPYFTAHESLVSCARVQPEELVVVQGANGMVGRASLFLAKALGAETVALVRRDDIHPALEGADHVVDTRGLDASSLGGAIHEATGRDANVFIDTVGGESTAMGITTLGPGGRLVVMASPHPSETASFNVFEFYRKKLQVLGTNTISDEVAANALKFLCPLFESGQLQPLPIDASAYSLHDIPDALDAVRSGIRARVLIKPWK